MEGGEKGKCQGEDRKGERKVRKGKRETLERDGREDGNKSQPLFLQLTGCGMAMLTSNRRTLKSSSS